MRVHEPRIIVLAMLGCTVAFGRVASAADVTVPAKIAVVKPGKVAKFLSKSTAPNPLPGPGSAVDPTVGGADLYLSDTGGSGGQVKFRLDASGWAALGRPPGTKGYLYKGKNDALDASCKAVALRGPLIKAVCTGPSVNLTTPFAGTAGIVLGLPAGPAAQRYCAELAGDEKRNDEGGLRRKDAPAPAACAPLAEPPFADVDANDLEALAADALLGRNNNTPGSIAAQQILIDALKPIATGLNTSQAGDDAFRQPFVQSGRIGTNLLAVMPGGDLAHEYVVIGAHYDHLGSCRTLGGGDVICNGATDNAAGAVVVLAVGRALAHLPVRTRRSVILAFWDAEEDGLFGSLHYVQNPLVPIASTVAYVNLDIQGANLLPSLKRFTFAVGAETGGSALRGLVDAAMGGVDLDGRALSYIFGQGRSDYVNFVNANVPTVFFSDSTGPCYHTTEDEVGVVDFGKLDKQSRVAFDVTRALADAATPPAFAGPAPGLATFDDALIIHQVVTAGLADLALFSPADQATFSQFHSDLGAIVAAGPGSFDSVSVTTLLLGTLNVVDLLTRTTCDGFL